MRMYEKDLREAYGEALLELGEEYPDIVVLDADLCTSTGTDLFRDRFPQRFFQCGIAEGNMFGMAAGLAAQGYKAFPSTFAAFAARRALDPIYMQICAHNADVKISGAYPGITATQCGLSHNCCEDTAVMAALPGIRIADIGDNIEMRSAMKAFAQTEGPVYFRVPKAQAPILFREGYEFVWGKGVVLREGGDAAILSTGIMTGIALAAAEILGRKGIKTKVAHMPSVRPMDEELVERCARETGVILTLENGRGFGGLVSGVAAKRCPARVEQMGAEGFVRSGKLYDLIHECGLAPSDVAGRVCGMLGRKDN
jgi:transketolase